MSTLKPTRLQSKQILVTLLNYLNQNFWNFLKWAFFPLELRAGSGQRARASSRGDLLTAFVPLPSPPTAPLSKHHHHHKVFTTPLPRVRVLSQLSHSLQRGCLAPSGLARAAVGSPTRRSLRLRDAARHLHAKPCCASWEARSVQKLFLSPRVLVTAWSSVLSSCWETADLDKVLEEFWWASAACRGHGTWKECEKWMEIVRCTVVIQRSCLSFFRIGAKFIYLFVLDRLRRKRWILFARIIRC